MSDPSTSLDHQTVLAAVVSMPQALCLSASLATHQVYATNVGALLVWLRESVRFMQPVLSQCIQDLLFCLQGGMAKRTDGQAAAHNTKLSLQSSRAATITALRPHAFSQRQGQAVQQQPHASSEAPASRFNQGLQRNIADMLNRLQLLQQEGSELAVAV